MPSTRAALHGDQEHTRGGLMIKQENRRRRTAPMRVAVTSLLVASGIGAVGAAPALAAGDSPTPAALHSGDDRDRGRDHDHWFSDRGDVRYVWFRVCDTAKDTTTATTTSGTTSQTPVPDTTTETVAPEAITAAVEAASTESTTATDINTATATDTVTSETTTDTTTTEPTPETATADDEADAKLYPTFIVVPLPKDEAKALRKLDDRPCYDLTTRAPATTDTTTATTTATTTSTTDTPSDPATGTETTTASPANTASTG